MAVMRTLAIDLQAWQGPSIESDLEVTATKIPLVHQLATCHATAVAQSHHPNPWQQDRSDLSKNPGFALAQSQKNDTQHAPKALQS